MANSRPSTTNDFLPASGRDDILPPRPSSKLLITPVKDMQSKRKKPPVEQRTARQCRCHMLAIRMLSGVHYALACTGGRDARRWKIDSNRN